MYHLNTYTMEQQRGACNKTYCTMYILIGEHIDISPLAIPMSHAHLQKEQFCNKYQNKKPPNWPHLPRPYTDSTQSHYQVLLRATPTNQTHLLTELSGGRTDEPDGSFPLRQFPLIHAVKQQRPQVGRRLSRASLGHAYDITPTQCCGDGLRLDGSGCGEL